MSTGMHGPTCIGWANLTPSSLKVIPWVLFAIQAEWIARVWAGTADLPAAEAMRLHLREYEAALSAGENSHPRLYHVLSKVRKTPSWPRSWAKFSLL